MRRRRKNHQKLERWIEQPVVLSSRSRANFSESESSSVGGDTTTMRPSPSGRAFLRRGRRQVAPRVLVGTCHAYGIPVRVPSRSFDKVTWEAHRSDVSGSRRSSRRLFVTHRTRRKSDVFKVPRSDVEPGFCCEREGRFGLTVDAKSNASLKRRVGGLIVVGWLVM